MIQNQLPRGVKLGKMPKTFASEQKMGFIGKVATSTVPVVVEPTVSSVLEEKKKENGDGCLIDDLLQPCIVEVNEDWKKREMSFGSQANTFDKVDKKKEKNICIDLLDSLTKSGIIEIDNASGEKGKKKKNLFEI